MNELTIINKEGVLVVDSREVAEALEIRHDNLLAKIKSYCDILATSNLRTPDFFIESTYLDAQGKERPCYLLTKKGCDMVANKMTGEKGVIFTAKYVTKFEEMEKQLKNQVVTTELSPQLQLLIQMELKQKELEQKTQILEHRINNLDATNIEGTPRQRLNQMIRKYAFDKGIPHNKAWQEFRSNFNRAYGMNIEQRRANYIARNGIKDITYPEFLERIGFIEDALRVADKMLNS